MRTEGPYAAPMLDTGQPGRSNCQRQPTQLNSRPPVARCASSSSLATVSTQCSDGPKQSCRARRSAPQLAFDSPDSAVIIFDWDDTLFPTRFLTDANVLVKRPPLTIPEIVVDGVPLVDTMARHAVRVKKVLEMARCVARVAIVTLASRQWVFNSSDLFLPGLKAGELFHALDIPVYCAKECLERHDGAGTCGDDGVDLSVVAKRRAILKCLRRFYGRKALRMNVTSIGDSMKEANAIKEVMWTACEHHGGEHFSPLCKTVKLLSYPSAVELNDELLLVGAWLKKLVAHADDFDLAFTDIEDCVDCQAVDVLPGAGLERGTPRSRQRKVGLGHRRRSLEAVRHAVLLSVKILKRSLVSVRADVQVSCPMKMGAGVEKFHRMFMHPYFFCLR